MSKQLGFYFDAGRCVQCHACEVACKGTHELELGPRWRRVLDRWAGEFPLVVNTSLSVSCFHCAEPACANVCPVAAISKRVEDGVVVVNQQECIGCRACRKACPYGAPQFGHNGKMQKCYLCTDRIALGLQPSCVATCPGEALSFGDIEELAKLASAKGGGRLEGKTKPSGLLVSTKNAANISIDFHSFFKKSNIGRSDSVQD
jgi:anaerobic dimethyl sulfoxide reductase subunit B (iron-sulfur subunit)